MMSRLSVRARLTLWNVGVLALVLIALGFSVRAIVHFYLIQSIDIELSQRADLAKRGWWQRVRSDEGKFVWTDRFGHVNDNWHGGHHDDGPHHPGDGGPQGPEGSPSPRPSSSPVVPVAVARPLTASPDASPSPEVSPSPEPSPLPDTVFPRLIDADVQPLRIGPMRRNPVLAWDADGIVQSRRTHTQVYRTVLVNSEPYRVITVPVKVRTASDSDNPADFGKATGPTIYEQMAFRLTDVLRGLSALDRALLTLLPLSLIVAGLGGSWLTGRALRPVRDITLATDRIAAESLAGRLPVSGNDEFSELSRRFNGMLERLETSFERQRRFTADASHELRTPLAIVTANASLALDDEAPPTPEGSRRAFVAINGAANRMSRIVGDLLLLAQSDNAQLPIEHKLVNLHEVLQVASMEAVTSHKQRSRSEAAEILLRSPSDVFLKRGDAHYLTRAFVNLLENALRHTPSTGSVVIGVSKDDEIIHVIFADTGTGISPEHLPRLFDRFYRADAGRDRERGGTGLGLAIVRTIIAAHGGAVSITSEVGRGTTVTISLPV